jgi:hypothetical protein
MLRRLAPLAAVAVLAVGCSRGEYETAEVSGRVTLNGQPVANVAVMFQPVAPEGNINPGPGSYGVTDADGRYHLILVGKESKGAVVGKHMVRISNHDDTPQDPSDDSPRRPKKAVGVKIPSKYNQAVAILEFDVPADGTEEANFTLSSP